VADATEHHFTGKERDTESGNDYFGARYYASSMGRYMSPDWSSSPEAVPYADLGNPQTLNLYSYLGNNPLGGVDADGHCAGWLQWLCNAAQSVKNGFASDYGFHTDKTVQQKKQSERAYVLNKQSTDAQKSTVSGLGDSDIHKMYEYYTDPKINAMVNAMAKVTVLPDGLGRDGTGKIHGDIPDHVPDNWTDEQLEEARDELRQSIQRRKDEMQQLGEEGGHRERLRQEEQLLRQVEKKLSGS
jgi:RHS repeat-associated protein